MLMIEPATAVRFSAGSFDPTTSRRLSHSGSFSTSWNKFQRLADTSHMRKNSLVKNRVRASAEEQSEAASSPLKPNPKPSRYHPFEDIEESELIQGGEATLSPAETTRTIIEVFLMMKFMRTFSGQICLMLLMNMEVRLGISDIYFQVKSDEDILRTLTAEDNFVQVIVGLDTAELLSEMELAGPSEIDFGIDELDEDDDDDDDDDDDEEDEDDNYDKEWVSILDDEEDQEDSDESLGDWAKLDTMRTSHPMYFAKKLEEVVSDDPLDFMDQPPAGLAIQGLLRPAFIEEQTVIQKQISDHKSGTPDLNQVRRNEDDKIEDLEIINGHRQSSQDSSIWAEELEKSESFANGTSFYKLEMIKVQLISAHGNQTVVEVEDLRKAQPDAIAHSAGNIISRLKDGGEKTMQALKSLCWRCKGIQVEEAAIIGVDTLGFDLRVCSGRQLQTLRFSFNKRASSEYSAERALNDLLFPRTHLQKKREAHQTES